MPCTHINLGNGAHAIVCQSKPRRKRCSVCGEINADRQCDWKLPDLFMQCADGRAVPATCDAYLCGYCTYQPAPGKDLCPEHRADWDRHPKNTNGATP